LARTKSNRPREELASPAPLLHRERREEVLVDEPERVTLHCVRDRREEPDQLDERRLPQPRIHLRQDSGQLGVVPLDGLHRVVEERADVHALGSVGDDGEPGLLGEVQDSASLVVLGSGPATPTGRRLDLLSGCVEPLLGEGQKDESQDRIAVLGGRQVGVRPQLVGRRPQPPFECTQPGSTDAAVGPGAARFVAMEVGG